MQSLELLTSLVTGKCIKKVLARFSRASQVALAVKNMPANPEDAGVIGLILGWKDPLA